MLQESAFIVILHRLQKAFSKPRFWNSIPTSKNIPHRGWIVSRSRHQRNKEFEMVETLSALTPNETFDVVVVGAGGAGMSAALFAAIDGARVLLVESTEYVGGTTAYSAGTTWIPGSLHARRRQSRRHGRERRSVPATRGRRAQQPGDASGVSCGGPEGGRAYRGELGGEIPRAPVSSRLPVRSRRLDAARPRAGTAALRRPQARQALRVDSSADSGIHRRRRNDGRSRRRRASAQHDPVARIVAATR